MKHPYEVTSVVRGARNTVKADLTENGIVIAAVVRRPGVRCVWPFEVKFLSSHAEVRFQSFCESLSVSETVEALL